jgi:hypothetical protein
MQVKAQAEVERRQRTAALNEELLARQQAEELLLTEQVTFEPPNDNGRRSASSLDRF